jgi:hypothetical protein
MFGYYRMRVTLAIIILSVVAVVMGVGELWRCGRAIMGPSTVAFAPSGMGELASHGYVRVTGVRAATDRIAVVTKSKRGGGEGAWKAAYIPLLDATDETDAAQCVLLAWSDGVRNDDDLQEMADLTGPDGDEVVGFVKTSYERLDPSEQQKLAPLVRANTRNCWVIDVRRPSWFKGLGLTLLGLAIPGGWMLWKSRQPLGSGYN